MNFAMDRNGWLIGQAMFWRVQTQSDDGRQISIVAMGRTCVAPD